MFHQDSTTQWNKLRIWKICNFVVSNSIDKSHRNSVCPQFVCDKSQNARGCAKWQWNTLDWCYWIARPASPVVQSSNTVSCVSLSFRTPPCVLAIKYKIICNIADTRWQKKPHFKMTNLSQPGPTCTTNTLLRTNPSDVGLKNREIACIDYKWR